MGRVPNGNAKAFDLLSQTYLSLKKIEELAFFKNHAMGAFVDLRTFRSNFLLAGNV
jgi:hypothetical protein